MSIYGKVVRTEHLGNGDGVITLGKVTPKGDDPGQSRLFVVQPARPLPAVGTVLWGGSETLLEGETVLYRREGYVHLYEA